MTLTLPFETAPLFESYSINVKFSVTIVKAAEFEKGVDMEWFIEGNDTFVLKRILKSKSLLVTEKTRLG